MRLGGTSVGVARGWQRARLTLGCGAVSAALWLVAPVLARGQSPAKPLESEFMFELVLDVDPQLDAGEVRIAPITGGTFAGPGMRGTVRPGGADWITRSGGDSHLSVRIVLETDDGELIAMTYTGVVSRGDSGTYWGVRPIFHTASEKYGWINHMVAVGKSKAVPGKVAYDIFRME